MSANAKPEQATKPDAGPQPSKRTRLYTFPDIDGGGPAVTIEASSLKEATETFLKGQATA